jgi:hypothetical protein
VSAVAEVAPAPTRAAPQRGVVRSLAWGETRRLLVHPLVLVGLALSALLVQQTRGEDSSAYLLLMGAGVGPLSLGVMLAANAAALRVRRDDAGELFGALPASAAARTSALLVAVAGAAVATGAVVLVEATVVGAWSGLDVTYAGQVEIPSAINLVQAPLLVALFGAFGVALARVLPTLAAGPLMSVAVIVAGVTLVAWGSQHPLRWLFPSVSSVETPGDGVAWPCDAGDRSWCPTSVAFDDGTMAVHALYLIALTALAASVALLADGRTARRACAVVACGSAAAILGALQVA